MPLRMTSLCTVVAFLSMLMTHALCSSLTQTQQAKLSQPSPASVARAHPVQSNKASPSSPAEQVQATGSEWKQGRHVGRR